MSNDNNKNNENNKIRRKKVSSSNSSSSRSKKTSTPKKKDKFKFLRVTGVAILAILVLASGLGAGLIFSSLKDVEPVTKALLDEKTHETSTIDYSNNEPMTKVANTNKKDPVLFEEMPQYIKDAVISIEDERYYEHNGVDIKGLLRSVVKTLTGDKQGGSTIPMQVSKILLTSSEQTIPRKIKDIYYAYEMSKTLSKDEILEVYLNNFDLGRSNYGIKAGAKHYFDKDNLQDLTLAECAMLAGVTKHPSKLAPYVTAKLEGNESKEDLEQRLLFFVKTDSWDEASEVELEMIDKLKDWGMIDGDTHAQLIEGTLVIRKAGDNPNAKDRQETVLMKMLDNGYITQAEHDEAVAAKITIKVPKKEEQITSSVEEYITSEVIESLQEFGYTEDEAKNMFYNGGININSTIDKNMQAVMDDEYANNNNFPNHKLGPNGIDQPQSASVVIDYKTGHIKSLIGGRNIEDKMAFNRATNPHHPGSTIKPLSVYTPAIDTEQITQSDSLSDIPGNYRFNYKGWNPGTTTPGKENMSLRKAMAWSSNPIAIRTAEMLGNSPDECYDIMIDYLRRFGITTVKDSPSGDRSMASLTLGGMSTGISPLEMAAAYGALANDGKYIEPIVFTTVETYDGKILIENTPEEMKVVDPEVAYVMTDMLKAVVSEGTGKSAKFSGMPVAGKTGTTNDSVDIWFVGYTPYYVGATYIGDDKGVYNNDTDSYMERRSMGSSSNAAKLWGKIMGRIHSNLEIKPFSQPDGVYFTTINLTDGGTTTPGAYNSASAAFITGTSPKNRTYQTNEPEEEEEEEPEVEEPEVEEPEIEEPEVEEPEVEEPEIEEPEIEEPEIEEPEVEEPDPEKPDPEIPDPEIPDPEIPDPEVPDTEE